MTVQFLTSMLVPELPVMVWGRAAGKRIMWEVATAGEFARGGLPGSLLTVADWRLTEGGFVVKVKEVQA